MTGAAVTSAHGATEAAAAAACATTEATIEIGTEGTAAGTAAAAGSGVATATGTSGAEATATAATASGSGSSDTIAAVASYLEGTATTLASRVGSGSAAVKRQVGPTVMVMASGQRAARCLVQRLRTRRWKPSARCVSRPQPALPGAREP